MNHASSTRGSSPLTRGKLNKLFELGEIRGLIPAHAGKTGRWRLRWMSRGAHPRSRGENWPLAHTTRGEYGSSPLTRGKHSGDFDATAVQRLIPAHAGKTRLLGWRPSRGRAHPRSRGENERVENRARRREGSSPLTRGKHCASPCTRPPPGLIPAHAGKTAGRVGRGFRLGAHPRSRGENEHADYDARLRKGSSPLTRGKHSFTGRRASSSRLIPAHAGKT